MGTCYLILKIDKGEYYDLGKSLGWSCFPDTVFTTSEVDKEVLINKFIHEMTTGFWDKTLNYEQYSRKITDNLFEWAGTDRLAFTTDSQDLHWDDWSQKHKFPDAKFFGAYTETGNRYIE